MYDVHTHFIPPQVMQWIWEHKDTIHAQKIKKDAAQKEFLSINDNWAFELKEAFINLQLYLDEQEKAGIAHSIISPIPQLFLYDFVTDITKELSMVYNDGLAAWMKTHKERLSALATLPMNDPALAAAELERAMNQGLRGAIIGSSWAGNRLSEEKFTPFWAAANERKAIIFIHPLLCSDPRLRQRKMPNLIGVPWETTVSATDILLSGLMDRYPQMKIVLAHGGGFLPYQLGRLNKGFDKWSAVSEQMSSSPLETAKRFWYDSVLWNPAALQYLVDLVGADRVLPGTDFPFDLCEWPPAIEGSQSFQLLLND